MSPEAAYYLEKANRLLGEANAMLQINLTEAAARTAYLAGFHAAQAFISEKTGRSVKTHKGVHSELQRLTKDDLRFSSDLRAFLPRTYNLKSIADYETGPGAEVSLERATMALAQAQNFVAHLDAALASLQGSAEPHLP